VDVYNGKSYFKTKQMRHPLIELIHEKVIYVDNDVELLKEKDECLGILLMGLNGVGKSSMAKAIGCNIVMAQMGMFVAAKEFEYYPYTKIFTRINGDDNIFKGMSSFVVEMNELRSILKYSDERSIVLGDEVCKGTEETSALSIVSSTIQRFSERDVNFIMATHFHKLHEMEEIQELTNVRFKHLSVEYDREGDRIIYGRKLMDGPGDTLYGLEIAQFLIKDEDFIKKARKIRDKLICQSEKIIEDKRSNYHKELVMDCCMICKKNGMETQLHTHHLKEQSEFEEEGLMNIDGIRKNQLGNLVVLCEEHHEETHHGRLKIEGWIESTMGRSLKWYYEEEKDEEIEEEEEDEEEKMRMRWIEEEIEKMKKMGIEKKNMKKNIQQRLKRKGWEINQKTLQMYMDRKREENESEEEDEVSVLVV
jgi:DNA mismatch repair protein MutS